MAYSLKYGSPRCTKIAALGKHRWMPLDGEKRSRKVEGSRWAPVPRRPGGEEHRSRGGVGGSIGSTMEVGWRGGAKRSTMELGRRGRAGGSTVEVEKRGPLEEWMSLYTPRGDLRDGEGVAEALANIEPNTFGAVRSAGGGDRCLSRVP